MSLFSISQEISLLKNGPKVIREIRRSREHVRSLVKHWCRWLVSETGHVLYPEVLQTSRMASISRLGIAVRQQGELQVNTACNKANSPTNESGKTKPAHLLLDLLYASIAPCLSPEREPVVILWLSFLIGARFGWVILVTWR